MRGRIRPRVRDVQATSSCWVTLQQEEGKQQQQPSFPGFYCGVWMICGLVFITMWHRTPAEPHEDTGAADSPFTHCSVPKSHQPTLLITQALRGRVLDPYQQGRGSGIQESRAGLHQDSSTPNSADPKQLRPQQPRP